MKNETHSTRCIGALFRNKYQTKPTHPHLQGTLEISEDVLKHLNDCYRNGTVPTLQLSAWKNRAKTNDENYLTVMGRKPSKSREAEQYADDDDDDLFL